MSVDNSNSDRNAILTEKERIIGKTVGAEMNKILNNFLASFRMTRSVKVKNCDQGNYTVDGKFLIFFGIKTKLQNRRNISDGIN